MRVVSVVGARPQFIKVAPIDWALLAAGHEHQILHTGQHYDNDMSGAFFDELEISAPEWNLKVGSGPHGAQTAEMLVGCEEVLSEAQPDWVICYGDTNSTTAAALAAVKLGIRVAHVEAGLRSFNRSMPEEHNRVVVDHMADLLLAPTQVAIDNLSNEGLADRSLLVGDVMADVVRRVAQECRSERGDYVVATVHRAENTDHPDRLKSIIASLAELPVPVKLFAHPRLVSRAADFDIDLHQGSIQVLPPASHRALLASVRGSRGVITDSGGVQKEAYMLGSLCSTLRGETEWIGTLDGQWNVLVEPEGLADAVLRDMPVGDPAELYGDGEAAVRIVDALAQIVAP